MKPLGVAFYQLITKLSKKMKPKKWLFSYSLLKYNIGFKKNKSHQANLFKNLLDYADLLNLAHEGIIIRDLHGCIIFWNLRAEEMYGFTKDEALEKNHHNFLQTQFSQPLSEIEMKLFDRGIWDGELIQTKKDGSEIIVASRWAIKKLNNKISVIFENNHDITDAKKAEENLIAASVRFATILDIAEDAIICIDENQKISLFNQGAVKIFGYATHEVLGKSLSLLLPECWAEIDEGHTARLTQCYVKSFHKGKLNELIGCRKDGTEFPVEASISQIELGSGKIFTLILRDISERQKAEEELRHQEEEFRALIENAPDAIARYDRDLRCQYINPEIERQLGIPPQAFIGKTISEVGFTNEFQNMWKKVLQKVFITGRQEPIEFELATVNGKAYYQARVVPEFSRQGKVEFVLAIICNITELKKIQKDLEQANERLNKWVEELALRNREIALLGKMSDILQACMTIDEAYKMLAQLVKPLFPDVSGGIFVISSSKDLAEAVSTWVSEKAGSVFSSKKIFSPHDCWSLRRGRHHLVKYSELSLQCKHVQLQMLGKQELLNNNSDHKCEISSRLNENYHFITELPEKHTGEKILLNEEREETIDSKTFPNWISEESQNFSLLPIPAETLCVPMMAQGEALGILYLTSQKPGYFTPAKEQLAVTVAEHIGLALANLKLREALQQQSIRDSLTGLYNRRYLEESLEREISRAIRLKQTLGVIMIDVDHFKRYNDSYGHDGGDAVLRELGRFLQEKFRGSDIACRYGGEEFTVIVPEASLETIIRRAEFIREGIKRLKLQHRRQQLGSITVSLGVAIFPDRGLTGEAVIAAADGALYEAKKQGRDRVIVAE